ncbi:hypothetical protein JCM14036_12410 [Desulfotomaculum defluvii]
MILSKARQLKDRLEEKKQLRDSMNQLQGYKTRKQRLEEFIQKVEPLTQTSQVLRQQGIGTPKADNAKTVAKIIGEIQGKYREQHSFIHQPKSLDPLKAGIDSFAAKLNAQNQTIWNQYMEKVVPITNQNLLDVLNMIPTFKGAVRDVQTLSREIGQYKNNPPKTQQDVDNFTQKVEKLKLIWGQLGSEDIPNEVLVFLQSAVIQGASLDLLTDSVRNWLNKNGIQSFFRIKLSS